MKKNTLINSFILLLGFLAFVPYIHADSFEFVLSDNDCSISGGKLTEDKVSTKSGSLAISACKHKLGKIECFTQTKDSNDGFDDKKSLEETYNIIVETPKFLALESKSKNIKFLIDKNSHRFTYGTVTIEAENFLIMTKICTGTYLTYSEVKSALKK